MTPDIYVATSLENAKLAAAVMGGLRAWGAKITYDWTTHGSVAEQPVQRRREVASNEANGVRDAGLVVVLLPGGRGTHVELGIAVGLRIPALVIWSGEDGPGRTVFYDAPDVYKRYVPQMTADQVVEAVVAFWGELSQTPDWVTGPQLIGHKINLLEIAAGLHGQVCQVCGCTDAWGCDGGCSWVDAEFDLCSACLPLLSRLVAQLRPSNEEQSERTLCLAFMKRTSGEEVSG